VPAPTLTENRLRNPGGISDRPRINGLILVVRRLDSFTERLCAGFRDEGFQVISASDGARGLKTFQELHPTAVLADLDIELLGGIDLCRLIRASSRVPIVVLASGAPEADRTAAIECGADDCITTPCSLRELIFRVGTRVRRRGTSLRSAEDAPLVAGILHLYRGRREVYVRGRLVEFPRKEFDVLEVLMRNPGWLVTRTRLLSEVWGDDYYGDTRTLDVHIMRIRAKVEEEPHRPRHVKTVRGYGYNLQA
jgi:two-component system response regulator RegX3